MTLIIWTFQPVRKRKKERKKRKKKKKEIYVYLFGFGNSVIFELMKN